MANQASNIEVIETVYNSLLQFQKKPQLWGDDASVIELYDILAKSLNAEIHGNLVNFKSKENEAIIRNLIRRYVIGGKEKKALWVGALPCIEAKISFLAKKKNKDHTIIEQYLNLHDDFMALASFRSYKHFCLYMESEWDKKVFKPQLKNFEGYFFYANQMVLDHSVQFIEKQCPTGRGKSLSDCFQIAWIYGQDYLNADVGKIFGNKYNCSRCIDTICTLMTDRKYSKVFPYYQQFNGKRDNVFSTLKTKDGEFKINGSMQPVSFLTVGKESKISGSRFQYLFLDDITQAEDAASIKQHDKDIATYLEVWARRKHSNNNFFIVASGTTYSIYDILSWLKVRFNYENSIPTKYKYTRIAKTNRLVANGTAVFVTIPALDYDTDESTYPEEYPTSQLRQMREDNYEVFMAMEQQQPLQPKDNPFYITRLLEYESLPDIGVDGRTESCWAYLDGKRKGSDFCSMPIFSPIGEKHFLIDVFYDNRPMKDLYGGIISKIRQHHITKLIIENNINEGLKTLLEKLLLEQGITYCDIQEVYNTAKKDIRISNAEADIKSSMVFPKYGLYSRSSPMGQALDELYGYSYVRKVEHDDFTDSIAGYCENFITKTARKMATISIFGR